MTAVRNLTMVNDNIFLIGMMGAGKSIIGKQLAQELDKQFVDSDDEIETKTGVGVEVIFTIEGETGFRRRETDILRVLTRQRGIVLATGGGATLVAENRQLLKDNGLIVYLRASPEHLANRLRYDKQRPLLQSGDRLKTIRTLLARRESLYRDMADLIVTTDDRNMRQIIGEISVWIRTQ